MTILIVLVRTLLLVVVGRWILIYPIYCAPDLPNPYRVWNHALPQATVLLVRANLVIRGLSVFSFPSRVANFPESFWVFHFNKLSISAHFHILLTEECSISNLSLRGNGITCEHMPLFCSALTQNKSIIKLSLHNNKISDEGVITLAKVNYFNNLQVSYKLQINFYQYMEGIKINIYSPVIYSCFFLQLVWSYHRAGLTCNVGFY